MKTEFWYLKIPTDERVLEIPFFIAAVKNFCLDHKYLELPEILDVGGKNSGFIKSVEKYVNYHCCDLDCGEFRGDFNTFNFGNTKFNIITALSSIEHFGDLKNNMDIEACRKIGTMLKPGGRFIISVGAGKLYHDPENFYGFIHYDQERIHKLVEASGLSLVEERYFGYDGEGFVEVDYDNIKDVSYRDREAPNACGVFFGTLIKE